MVSRQVWRLIPVHVLLGSAAGGYVVAPLKVISTSSGGSNVQRCWSIFLVWLGIRGIVAPVLAGEMYRSSGSFNGIFAVCGLAMLALLAWNEVMLRKPRFQSVFAWKPSR